MKFDEDVEAEIEKLGVLGKLTATVKCVQSKFGKDTGYIKNKKPDVATSWFWVGFQLLSLNAVGVLMLTYLYNHMVDFQEKTFRKKYNKTVAETNKFTICIEDLPDKAILKRTKSTYPDI